jgi:hypothetical protein
MQAKKVKTMQGDLERYMVSYESANKLEAHEVEVDLCMPLGPTNFDAPPNRGNETALQLSKLDRTKIQEATRKQDLPESKVLHSSNRPHLGFADSSDSESDEEDTLKHEAQDNRVDRLRMIRAMRQTVARAAAAGPTANNSDDVEVAV